MKSLVTTFLVFATCLVIAGTIALIDQAQATLSLSSSEAGQLTPAEKARVSDRTTLSEFANSAQEKFSLPQPEAPVVFDDVRPSDPSYTAAQAVYPFLHRQLLCPDCALTSNFYGRSPLTRAQAAVALVSILIRERKITLGDSGARQRTSSPMFPMPTRSPYSSVPTSLPLWEKEFSRSSPEIWFVPQNRIRIQRWRCSSIQCNGVFRLLPLRPACVSDTRRDDEQQSELDRRYPFSAARSLA